jgi:hypothetical protein
MNIPELLLQMKSPLYALLILLSLFATSVSIIAIGRLTTRGGLLSSFLSGGIIISSVGIIIVYTEAAKTIILLRLTFIFGSVLTAYWFYSKRGQWKAYLAIHPLQALSCLLVIAAVIFLTPNFFPANLFYSEGEVFHHRFYVMDSLWKSSLSQEILRVDYHGPIKNPFGYPKVMFGYHISSDIVDAFLQQFVNANIISYHYVRYLSLFFLLIYILKPSEPSGLRKSVLHVGLGIMVIELMSKLGTEYSIFEHLYFNPASCFAGLCVMAAFSNQGSFRNFSFFVIGAALFKSSFLPVAVAIILAKLNKQTVLNIWKDLPSYAPHLMLFFGIASTFYAVKSFDTDYWKLEVAFRFNVEEAIKVHDIHNWTLFPINRLVSNRYFAIKNATEFFIILIGCLIGCFVFLSKALKLVDVRIKILFVAWISAAAVVLSLHTVGRGGSGLDPWITSFHVLWPCTLMLAVELAAKGLTALSLPRKGAALSACVVLGLALLAFGPIPNSRFWRSETINPSDLSTEVYESDRPLQASLLGRRLSHLAGNVYRFGTIKNAGTATP